MLKIDMLNFTKNTIKEILNSEYTERSLRNPSYSIRSFSRDMKLNVSTLSRLMRGEIIASDFILVRVADVLKLSAENIEMIRQEIAVYNEYKITKSHSDNPFISINENSEHFNILQTPMLSILLCYIDMITPTSFDLQNAASFLKLSISEVEFLTNSLKAKNLILPIENNSYKVNFDLLSVMHKNSSHTDLSNYYKFFISKSLEFFHEHNSSQRIDTGFTAPIDINLIPEVKKRMQNFTVELTSFIIANNVNLDSVYSFQSAMFSWKRDQNLENMPELQL